MTKKQLTGFYYLHLKVYTEEFRQVIQRFAVRMTYSTQGALDFQLHKRLSKYIPTMYRQLKTEFEVFTHFYEAINTCLFKHPFSNCEIMFYCHLHKYTRRVLKDVLNIIFNNSNNFLLNSETIINCFRSGLFAHKKAVQKREKDKHMTYRVGSQVQGRYNKESDFKMAVMRLLMEGKNLLYIATTIIRELLSIV
ncbi:MAG: hypothetical protein EXX96DRAFT_540251 [Benjaminiella poitrasii]|nr:MAG: hypothetical protein EXX96DRAFT_540251 [Benjaminiella poitrasii]